VFSADHPELVALMNIEARQDTDRLRYIYDNYIEPALTRVGRPLLHLAEQKAIRPIALREFHFLVAHGAAAIRLHPTDGPTPTRGGRSCRARHRHVMPSEDGQRRAHDGVERCRRVFGAGTSRLSSLRRRLHRRERDVTAECDS
jgi:hypothetical protein